MDVTIALSRSIHIDKTKLIEVHINTADNETSSLELRLSAGSAGLRLHTNKAETVQDDIKIDEKPNTGTIKFANLPANIKFAVQVPYDVETTLRELSIRPEVTYTTNQGEFVLLGNTTISVELPLDVNVFDIFKEKVLFSKFTVRTATRIPIQLLSVKLKESDGWTVASPLQSISPAIIFPKGPASFTYKVSASSRSPSKEETPLVMSVNYRCIDEDILESAEEIFREDLNKSSIADLTPVLIPALRTKFVPGALDIDYERAAMQKKLRLGSFEEMGWPGIIIDLPKARREEVSSWLKNWHHVSQSDENSFASGF